MAPSSGNLSCLWRMLGTTSSSNGISSSVAASLLLLLLLLVSSPVAGNPDAKRLYDDLLSNYNKLVRPVVNTTDVLKVCIKLKLSQLIDVVSLCLILPPFVRSRADNGINNCQCPLVTWC